MDIFIGNRCQGKTTLLIKLSAESGRVIVAPTMNIANGIRSQAKRMGVEIPEPISFNNFIKLIQAPSWRDQHPQRYLLDELSSALYSMGIDVATLDAGYVKELPVEPLDWAGREVALACAKEREMSEKKGEENYGIACYENALRAYRALMREGHDGFSISVTKGILNRLIDGKCLSPIEDTPDIWAESQGPKNDSHKHYQCSRMPSLFKDVAPDGTVTYSDVERVVAVDVDKPDISYHNGFTTRLVDKIFPITMPYFPPSKKFKVVRDECLVDPKNGDYDTVAYLYLLTPTGQKVELNHYFKEVDGKLITIEKAEFDERKNRRVDKK